jgi:hypothetical protein
MGDVFVVKKNLFSTAGVYHLAANRTRIVQVFGGVESSGLRYSGGCRSRAAGVGAGHPKISKICTAIWLQSEHWRIALSGKSLALSQFVADQKKQSLSPVQSDCRHDNIKKEVEMYLLMAPYRWKGSLLAAILFLGLQICDPVTPSNITGLGQPAAEKSIENFFRVMGGLIGNPLLNETAEIFA